MRGRTILITGANSGLGFESARTLAAMGAEVLLICRNQAKADAVKKTIADETGNSLLHSYGADLSSQSQIRSLANNLLEHHPKLDVFMNNAGLLLGKRTVTEDGYEATFSVNHLAYFLLTRLLVERLKESAPSRIINVSSMVHRWEPIQFDDLFLEKNYQPMTAYAQSKLANVMFTYALARRLEGTGVSVNCLHPGIVNTAFGRDGAFFYRMAKALVRPFFLSSANGAKTQIYLASSPGVEQVTGKYFVKQRIAKSSKGSYDVNDQERLWEMSEQMCDLPHWNSPTL